MSVSSKRRGANRGFSPARPSLRGQRAVRSAIENLESRTLMSVTAVTFNVGTTGSGAGTVAPTLANLAATENASDLEAAVAFINTLPSTVTSVTVNFTAPAGTITPSAAMSINDGSLTTLIINGANKITLGGLTAPFNISAGASAEIENMTFSGATSGAVTATSPLTLLADTFTSNTALGNGGAVSTSANLTVTGTKFTSNSANNGGAIYQTVGNLTVGTSTFTSNSAQADGGAIAEVNAATASPLINLTATNSFTSNTAATGGAYYGAFTGTGTFVSAINGDTFTSNSATGVGGGAIYSAGTTLYVGLTSAGATGTKDYFYNNAGKTGANGGAIYSTDKTLKVTGGTFGVVGNGASGSPANLPAVTNKAANGGAIYAAGTAATATIATSTFVDSSATGNGGAIDNADATLILTSDVFGAAQTGTSTSVVKLAGPNSAANGGAVYSTATTNTLTTDSFIDNYASGNGGGVYVSSTGSTGLVVTTGTFTGNIAANGGGIYSSQTAPGLLVQINGGTFSGNQAIVPTTAATFYGITDAASTDAVDGNGGAIFSAGTTLQIGTATKVTFATNKALNANVGSTGGNGGSIYSTDATTDIYADSFGTTSTTGSSATNNGGDVYFAGTGSTPTLLVTASNFEYSSTSRGSGGAIYDAGGSGSVFTIVGTLTGKVAAAPSSFLHNTAGHSGGAIFSAGGTGSTFTDNDATFTSNSALGNNGGALVTNDATANVMGGTFATNTAPAGAGGAILSAATSLTIGQFLSGTGGTTITKPSFTADTALNYGGGLFFDGASATLSISNASFTSDSAGNKTTTTLGTGAGGAIGIAGVGTSSFTISTSTFSKDTAATAGGAIYSYGDLPVVGVSTTLTLTTDTFTGDTAGGITITAGTTTTPAIVTQGNGGGVFTGDDTVNVTGTTVFQGDSAIGYNLTTAIPNAGFGGGVYSTSATLNISNATASTHVTFASDTATFGGGGLFFADTGLNGTGNIYGTTFTSDTANYNTVTSNSSNNVSFGGGILSNAGTLNVTGSTFNGDTASTAGGAISSQDDYLNVQTSNFGTTTADKATQIGGGAIYFNGAAGLSGAGTATIVTSNFSNDAAVGSGAQGGAIFLSNTAALGLLGNDTFTKNTSQNGGGAVYANAATTSIYNDLFSTNTTSGDSGGAIFSDTNGTLNVFDSLIYSNMAKYAGGGIYFLGNGGNIANVTFYKNVSQGVGATGATAGGGGGLAAFGTGTLTVTNSTFSANTVTAPTLGAGIDTGSSLSTTLNGGDILLQGDVIAGNTATSGTIVVSGTNHTTTSADLQGTFDSTSSFNLVGSGSTESGVANAAHSNQVGNYAALLSGGFAASLTSLVNYTGVLNLLTTSLGYNHITTGFTVSRQGITALPANVVSVDQGGNTRGSLTSEGASAT